MTLTVDVLPLWPLPAVRVSVAGVAAGVAWRVVGRTGRSEWVAGEGSGEAVFADPWAPLGLTVTYTLTVGTVTEVAAPVVRAYSGQHVVTDMSGRVVVQVTWQADGDPWDLDPRAAFLEVPGDGLPVGSFAPTAGAGGGAVSLGTVKPHTEALKALLAANRPVLLLHNAGACQVPDCDVEPVRTVMFTQVRAVASGRTDVRQRDWSLAYRLQRRPYAYLAPVATWADVTARWPTGADLSTSGLTNAELARGDWLVEE